MERDSRQQGGMHIGDGGVGFRAYKQVRTLPREGADFCGKVGVQSNRGQWWNGTGEELML